MAPPIPTTLPIAAEMTPTGNPGRTRPAVMCSEDRGSVEGVEYKAVRESTNPARRCLETIARRLPARCPQRARWCRRVASILSPFPPCMSHSQCLSSVCVTVLLCSYACLDAPPPPSGGLSGGWAFVIVFLVGFFVYCVVGVIIKWQRMGASGMEVVCCSLSPQFPWCLVKLLSGSVLPVVGGS